jgi:hypothetical protein
MTAPAGIRGVGGEGREPSGAQLALALEAASIASRLLIIARLRVQCFGATGEREAGFLDMTGYYEHVISDLQRDLEQLAADLRRITDDWGAYCATIGATHYAG